MGDKQMTAYEAMQAAYSALRKLYSLPGDIYDADTEPERLIHDDPLEAIEAKCDDVDASEGLTAAIRSLAPLTVTAYKRERVTDAWVQGVAERVIDRVSEDFDEAYGDPEDFDAIAVTDQHRALAQSLVRTMTRAAHVWRCEPSGEVTLTADELEALMRIECPEWWDNWDA